MADVNADTVKCPNCGAVIDPSSPTGVTMWVIRCEYCDKKIRIKKEEVARGPGGDLDVSRLAGQAAMKLRVELVKVRPIIYVSVALFAIVPIVVGLTIYFFVSKGAAVVGDVVKHQIEAPSAASAAPTTFPMACVRNQQLTLDNQTLHNRGSIINASGHCKLTISNCELTSDFLTINARGSAEVTITNSTIRGTMGAIKASGRTRFEISNSNIESAGTAIRASGQAIVALKGSKLSGGRAAYETNGFAKVTTTGTTVQGATE